jgi:hypothetical protein
MIIIASICFSLFFIEIHRYPERLKLNFKPFNCGSCLAAWTALILFLSPKIVTDIFFIMFVSGVIAPLSRNLMNWLWKKLY